MSDLTPEIIESLVRRFRELGSEIAGLAGEQAGIKLRLDSDLPLGWSQNVDGIKASKREPNRTFDLVTAIGLLTAEQKAECVKTGYDPAKIREAIEALGVLDDCMISDLSKAAVVKLS